MLRLSHASWFVLPAALLGGCPIYADGCDTNSDCDYAYVCDAPSGRCLAVAQGPVGPPRCNTTDDCPDGLVCDRYLRCVAPTDTGGASGTGGSNGTSAGASGAAGESGNGALSGAAGS